MTTHLTLDALWDSSRRTIPLSDSPRIVSVPGISPYVFHTGGVRFVNISSKLHSLFFKYASNCFNKKAQLSLTNPSDVKVCQKLLQFDVLTSLALTILAYLHSFSCCCVRNRRNPAKFTKNPNLWSSRSSKVIDLGVNRKPICDFIFVISSNFSRICYRFRNIHG